MLPDEDHVFQITPVFDVDTLMGTEAKLLIEKTEPSQLRVSRMWNPSEISGLVIGLLLLTLIVICLMICYFMKKRKENGKGVVSGRHALMVDHWEVDRNQVSLEEQIGVGAFCKVFRGTLTQPPTSHAQSPFLKPSKDAKRSIDATEKIKVVVKVLRNISDGDQLRDFLDEIRLMKSVGSHQNIVSLVGCCTVGKPLFFFTEYAPYGNLLGYLRKHRWKMSENPGDKTRGPYHSKNCETYLTNTYPTGTSLKATNTGDRIRYVNTSGIPKNENEDIQLVSFKSTASDDRRRNGENNEGLKIEDEDNEENVTPRDLMTFALQITQGMEYLAKKGLVHRVLTAYHVLLGEHKTAKVADYYANHIRNVPLKWMSIEAIFDQRFTTQSDVWAFGVVLWELVTLGGRPYPATGLEELPWLLKQGYRMGKPITCSDELYEMMTDCWKESPEGRPTFTQIRERLETMMQEGTRYLDPAAVNETCAYYNVPSFNSVNEKSANDGTIDIAESDEHDRCKQDDGNDKKQSTVKGIVEEPNETIAEKYPKILDDNLKK